jgi:hypothetical protein
MDKIYRFLYVREKPLMVKIVSFSVIVLSILRFVNYPLISGIMVLVGILLYLYQTGIEVDFKVHTYRNIIALGPLSFGKWEGIPPLKSISVFKATIVSSATSRANVTITQRDQVIQVNLITTLNKRIKLLETENKEEAFALAKKIAPILDLDIWDATEREGKWL